MPSRSAARDAEAIVSVNYEPLKAEILRAVAGRFRSEGFPAPGEHDLQVAYNEAWHGVVQHIISGRPVTSLPGLLFTICHRRALDAYRHPGGRGRVQLDVDRQAVDVDMAEVLDDRDRLARLIDGLRERLTGRERRAVALCVLHGYPRDEAAELLGINPKRFQRIMDDANTKMKGVLATVDTRGCGDHEWAGLMRDFALGTLTPEDRDYQRARSHIEGPDACVPCQRYVRGLRGLAVALPPIVPLGHPAGPLAGLLAYLRRLAGGHGASAGAASSVQGAGVAAGTAGGSGMGITLAGGAVKAAVVVGAAIAIAAGTAAVTGHHRRSAPHAIAAQLPPQARISVPQPELNPRSLIGSHSAARPRPRHTTVHPQPRQTLQVGYRHGHPGGGEAPPEFGFEGQPATEPAAEADAISATAAKPAPAQASRASSSASSEFGFE
jgi:DNA-directed RNA polymerase specialized sigma24 family protein